MVYEANVNKTLHYIKYCLLNNISKVYQYIRQPDILYIPGSYFLDKLEFKCQSRGMETCLHSRGAALNVRDTIRAEQRNGEFIAQLEGRGRPWR